MLDTRQEREPADIRRLNTPVPLAFPAHPVPGDEGEVTCTASSQVQEQCQSRGRLEGIFGPVRHERDPLRTKGRRNIACIRLFLGFQKNQECS